MKIEQGIRNIQNTLSDNSLSDGEKLRRIKFYLPEEYDYNFISFKELLLQQAVNSGKSKFKLLATMNSNINIFQWCDNQYNFIGMCRSHIFENGEKDYTVEYTLEELPDAIDNAERWLESVKENSDFSGSPYFISSLQIMSV